MTVKRHVRFFSEVTCVLGCRVSVLRLFSAITHSIFTDQAVRSSGLQLHGAKSASCLKFGMRRIIGYQYLSKCVSPYCLKSSLIKSLPNFTATIRLLSRALWFPVPSFYPVVPISSQRFGSPGEILPDFSTSYCLSLTSPNTSEVSKYPCPHFQPFFLHRPSQLSQIWQICLHTAILSAGATSLPLKEYPFTLQLATSRLLRYVSTRFGVCPSGPHC